MVFSLPANTEVLATVAAFTPPGCLLTLLPPPSGQKVSTWEPECGGASKTVRQQAPSEAPESISEVGVGGQSKDNACVPGPGMEGVWGGVSEMGLSLQEP